MPIQGHTDRKSPLPRRRNRRGATLVETGLVMTVFLAIVLGMLDLGIAVLRYHMLRSAATEICRKAVVHGKLANRLGTWGPAGITCTGDSAGVLSSAFTDHLKDTDLSEVHAQVTWLDGGNDQSQMNRVRVVLTMDYPVLTFSLLRLLPGQPFHHESIPLRAQATMVIHH